jgi:hypothetical protein
MQRHVSVACQIMEHGFSGIACASSRKPKKAPSTQLMKLEVAVQQHRTCAGLSSIHLLVQQIQCRKPWWTWSRLFLQSETEQGLPRRVLLAPVLLSRHGRCVHCEVRICITHLKQHIKPCDTLNKTPSHYIHHPQQCFVQ